MGNPSPLELGEGALLLRVKTPSSNRSDLGPRPSSKPHVN